MVAAEAEAHALRSQAAKQEAAMAELRAGLDTLTLTLEKQHDAALNIPAVLARLAALEALILTLSHQHNAAAALDVSAALARLEAAADSGAGVARAPPSCTTSELFHTFTPCTAAFTCGIGAWQHGNR